MRHNYVNLCDGLKLAEDRKVDKFQLVKVTVVGDYSVILWSRRAISNQVASFVGVNLK